MGSTSFKYRCPTCGRSVNFDHYWSHVTKCLKKSSAIRTASALCIMFLIWGCSSPLAPDTVDQTQNTSLKAVPTCVQVFHPSTTKATLAFIGGQPTTIFVKVPAWTETVCS